jgi:hypothetical protein
MAKSKSQKTYDLLKVDQAQIVSEFATIHQKFATDPEKHRAEFNEIGRNFINLVRSYERRLCAGMERTNNSVYSSGVSETFWKLIRSDFPLIDQVGVITKSS